MQCKLLKNTTPHHRGPSNIFVMCPTFYRSQIRHILSRHDWKKVDWDVNPQHKIQQHEIRHSIGLALGSLLVMGPALYLSRVSTLPSPVRHSTGHKSDSPLVTSPALYWLQVWHSTGHESGTLLVTIPALYWPRVRHSTGHNSGTLLATRPALYWSQFRHSTGH